MGDEEGEGEEKRVEGGIGGRGWVRGGSEEDGGMEEKETREEGGKRRNSEGAERGMMRNEEI